MIKDDDNQDANPHQTETNRARAVVFQNVGDQVTDVELNGGEEDGVRVVDQIESLCMNCEENGTTKLLLTKIPFFREIILMSFYCDHCHFRNAEVQPAGEIQTHGVKFTIKMSDIEDLQRQIVKSDTALIKVEDLNLEIPPGRGRLSNMEGIMSEVCSDLERDQDRRQNQHPELYDKIVEVVRKLRQMVSGDAFPFTVTMDDTAGNSSIEPLPSDTGRKYIRAEYQRSPQQNASLGLTTAQEDSISGESDPVINGSNSEEQSMDGVDILEGKMYTLPCECPGCGKPAAMNLQMVNVPFFKQVVITAVVCIHCEYRTNEVKTGGEIPEKGHRITLQVKSGKDLRRDILKSETCMLKVPECGVEVQPGTMGGKFTTVEGLLTQMREDLHASIFDVEDGSTGDSMPQKQKDSWDEFFTTLDKAISAEMEYSVVLEDPLANSYIQNYLAPEPDPQIQEEDYERTAEENEDLGLNDMRTHQNEDGEYVSEDFKNKPTSDVESNSISAIGDLKIKADQIPGEVLPKTF